MRGRDCGSGKRDLEGGTYTISMANIDFIQKIHTSTKRNYLEERVIGVDKAECSRIAKQFGREYWDGERKYGYGGYHYDGRWRIVAEQMAEHYGLRPGQTILDVGCGKGYLLYEFTQVVPGIGISGLDISDYAIENAKEEIKPVLSRGNTVQLPYKSNTFDLVISINVLHNLTIYDLWKSLDEIERVGKKSKYIVMDSYRNEEEKANLLYWQLTCEGFYTPQEWEWIFTQSGYRGDYTFIFYD